MCCRVIASLFFFPLLFFMFNMVPERVWVSLSILVPLSIVFVLVLLWISVPDWTSRHLSLPGIRCFSWRSAEATDVRLLSVHLLLPIALLPIIRLSVAVRQSLPVCQFGLHCQCLSVGSLCIGFIDWWLPFLHQHCCCCVLQSPNHLSRTSLLSGSKVPKHRCLCFPVAISSGTVCPAACSSAVSASHCCILFPSPSAWYPQRCCMLHCHRTVWFSFYSTIFLWNQFLVVAD